MRRVWRDHPDTLEADLQAIYGWEARGPGRHQRSGPWLRRMVEALLFHPNSMVSRRLHAEIQIARDARLEREKPATPTR